MRTLLTILFVAATLLPAGCAPTSGDRIRGVEQAGPGTQADSTAVSAYEELFFELHAELIEKIDSLEGEDGIKPNAVEADSIVRAAEDLYLRGDLTGALKLLKEAKRILEQAN